MNLAQRYVERASEYLRSAEADVNAEPPRGHAAQVHIINAAELSAKALLRQKTGRHPTTHQLAGVLAANGLIPYGVDEIDLARLFAAYFATRYGDDDAMAPDQLRVWWQLAGRLLDAARAYPDAEFEPAREGE